MPLRGGGQRHFLILFEEMPEREPVVSHDKKPPRPTKQKKSAKNSRENQANRITRVAEDGRDLQLLAIAADEFQRELRASGLAR